MMTEMKTRMLALVLAAATVGTSACASMNNKERGAVIGAGAGAPRSACTTKLETTRPSSSCMRGPYVLKMRATLISSPYWRW